MLKVLSALLLVSVVLLSVVEAGGKKPDIPRLRIWTMPEQPEKPAQVLVKTVTPGGLGSQIGLQVGDAILAVQLNGEKAEIKTSADLVQSLNRIRAATLKDPATPRAALTVMVERPKVGKLDLKGTIVRSEFTDKTDGGTLYYFRKLKEEK